MGQSSFHARPSHVCTFLCFSVVCLFVVCCFVQGVADPAQWGSRAKITFDDIARLTDETQLHAKCVQFWYYVQFSLHSQLLRASQYAAKHRVALKGDLPIGVARFGYVTSFCSCPCPCPFVGAQAVS